MRSAYHPSLTDGSLDHLGGGPLAAKAAAASDPHRPASRNPAPEKGPSVRLATLPRKENEELRIDLDEYGGFKFVSVRIWFRAPDGQWRPSQRGITVKSRELAAARDALSKAIEILGNGGSPR